MDWVKIFSTTGDMERALAPNRPRQLIVGDIRICLVLDKGELRAVEDTCTHSSVSLSKGNVNYLGEIVCPWHGYRFNLKTGRECAQQSRDLIVYPVKIDSDGVFIGL